MTTKEKMIRVNSEESDAKEVTKQIIELIKQLDSVECQAMTIIAKSLHAGESSRMAVEKAVEYLKTQTGYERQAKALLDGLSEQEEKHKAKRQLEYEREKERLIEEYKDLPAQELAIKLTELTKKYYR